VVAIFLMGSYWFLYSYLACLLMLPFLRSMARGLGGRETVYLVALQIAFAGVIPALEYLTGGGAVRINLFIPLIARNLFYMVIGYGIDARLDINQVKPRHIAALFAVGFVMLLLACLMTACKGRVDGGYNESTSQMFHDGFIAIPTIGAFILVKYLFAHVRLKPLTERMILYAGSLTFGIYLVHMMLMQSLRPICDTLLPAIRSLPAAIVWVLATVVVSGVLAALLKRVPFLGKLL
jgi:surface polysaccharide O-acyltransferase-like enzyme